MKKKRSIFQGSRSKTTATTTKKGGSDILEIALEKANVAVLYDSTDNTQDAIAAYREAISLLERAIDSAAKEDKARLQKIHESYSDRIRVLTSNQNPSPYSFSPPPSRPRSPQQQQQQQQQQQPSPPPSNKPSIDDKYMLQTINEEVNASWHKSSSRKTSKRKQSRPPSLVNDYCSTAQEFSQPGTPTSTVTPFDTLSTHTIDSARTIGTSSIFSNMFARRSQSRLSKISLSTQDLPDPKPSRSTPIPSFSQSAKQLRNAVSRRKLRASSEFKNHRDEEEEEYVSQLPPLPPILPLPVIEATPKEEDYFDLHSIGADNLLSEHQQPVSFVTTLKREPNLQPPEEEEEEKQRRQSTDSDRSSSSSEEELLNVSTTATRTIYSVPRACKTSENIVRQAPSHFHRSTTTTPLQQQASFIDLSKLDFDSELTETLQTKKKSFVPPPRSQSKAATPHVVKKTSGPLEKSSSKQQRIQDAPPSLNTAISRTRSSSNSSQSSISPTQSPRPRASRSTFDLTQSRSSTFFPSLVQGALSPTKERNSSSAGYVYNIDHFLDQSLPPSSPSNNPKNNDSHISDSRSLMDRLAECMQHGGYLTERLHIPKEIWNQPNIRLNAIETKVATCEALLGALNHMQTRTNFDNVSNALQDLSLLEQTFEQMRESFARKLFPEPLSPTEALRSPTSPTHQHTTTRKTSQALAAWSNRFSKSVERMTTRTSEDICKAYTETLIELFAAAKTLDVWHAKYIQLISTTPPHQAKLFIHALAKTSSCIETLHTVVCGFVIQDMLLLLSKWTKRHREKALE